MNILAKKSYFFHSQKIAKFYFFQVLRGIFSSRAAVRGYGEQLNLVLSELPRSWCI